MTGPSDKLRIGRRGALLLILASLTAAAPLSGRTEMQAWADDGGDSGGDGGGDGGDNDGGGNGGGGDGGSDGGSDSDGGGSDGDSDGNSGSGNDGSGSGGGNGVGTSGDGGRQSGRQSAQSRDSALATRLKGRIASIRDIESIAARAVPGEIIDVRLYRSRNTYIYRVQVLHRNGSVYDVRINAVNRRLLSARER